MAKNKSPHLKLVTPLSKEEQKERNRKRRGRIFLRRFSSFLILLLMLFSTYLVMFNRNYTDFQTLSSFPRDSLGSNTFEMFGRNIVRFNRDGVSLLNRRNQEVWIHSLQMQNPRMFQNGNSFVIADIGGNFIFVFQEQGFVGQITTRYPIERVSVSNQGIVSAVLRNDNRPIIKTYDAMGNILVENQVPFFTYGYPTALQMSSDGLSLAVSYLSIESGLLQSKIVYYHFGAEGEDFPNREVSVFPIEEHVVVEILTMSNGSSIAISDTAFFVLSGDPFLEVKKTKELPSEIRRVFYNDNHVGFLLVDEEQVGYQLHLYDYDGNLVFHQSIDHDYRNIQVVNQHILLYDNSDILIYTLSGVKRYEGQVEGVVKLLFPAGGINGFYVLTEQELKIIYLT